jgi:hypothetical protein
MLLTLVLGGLLVGGLVGVVLYFWPQIMGWARETVLPWVDRNFPEIADSVRLAFQDLDQVAVRLRRAVRTAWQRLRQTLFGQTAEFIERHGGRWTVQITSYLRNKAGGDKPVIRLVTEQLVDWDELPEDIRRQAIMTGASGMSVDIVTARDRLLDTA